jgi:hypothetical protein
MCICAFKNTTQNLNREQLQLNRSYEGTYVVHFKTNMNKKEMDLSVIIHHFLIFNFVFCILIS